MFRESYTGFGASLPLTCDNCGDELKAASSQRGMRYSICDSCETLHNLAWMQCRADGKAYVQAPVRLPANTQISRDRHGVHMVVVNRNWFARYGLLISLPGTVLGIALGLLAAQSDIEDAGGLALSAWCFTLMIGPFIILLSIQEMRKRVEFHANAWGITYREVSEPFGQKTQSLAWPAVRLIDAFAKKDFKPHSEQKATVESRIWIGIRIHGQNGEVIEVAPWINSVEQALFVTYHLQSQKRGLSMNTATPGRGPKMRRRGAGLRRTLVDLPDTQTLPEKRKGELACSRCGAPIAAESISAQHEAAICKYCGAIEDLTGSVPAYAGVDHLEFPSGYGFKRGSKGILVTKGVADAERRAKDGERFGLISYLVLFTPFPAATIAVIASFAERPWINWLIPFAVVITIGVILTLFFRYRWSVKAHKLLIKRPRILLAELAERWQTTIRIPRKRIRAIFAQTDVSGSTDTSCVVFELAGGETVASFDMPSPWHAQKVVLEARAFLKLQARN